MKDKSNEVLVYISDYIAQHEYPPSYEEIGNACGLKSKSSVYGHVKKLLKEGFLETEHEGCPRAYRLARKK